MQIVSIPLLTVEGGIVLSIVNSTNNYMPIFIVRWLWCSPTPIFSVTDYINVIRNWTYRKQIHLPSFRQGYNRLNACSGIFALFYLFSTLYSQNISMFIYSGPYLLWILNLTTMSRYPLDMNICNSNITEYRKNTEESKQKDHSETLKNIYIPNI